MQLSAPTKGQLTVDYDKWLQKITRKMWHKFGKYHEYEELLGVAYVASLEAEKSYNPALAKFSAYVKPRIEGAIIRSVSNISSSQHKIMLQMYAFIDKYIATHNRIPAQHIILKHLDITEAAFMDIIDSTTKITKVSTDDVGEDELISDVDMDLQAEFGKVMTIVDTLSKKHQKAVKNFIEDPTSSSEEIQDVLDIIRTRLKIQEIE